MTCMKIGKVTRHWACIYRQLPVMRMWVGKKVVENSRRTIRASCCGRIGVNRIVLLGSVVEMMSTVGAFTASFVKRMYPYYVRKYLDAVEMLKDHGGGMRLPILVLGLPVVLLAGCQGRRSVASHRVEISVRTTVARSVQWPETVSVPATVSAVEVADLASRNGGWISHVNVVDGQQVTQSQLLVTVGLSAARYRLVAAQSRLNVAKANWKAASANEARYVFLIRTHATSRKRYDQVHSAFITAKSELASARSALEEAKRDMDYANIRAPFSGTVVDKMVHRGTFVTAGERLLKIVGGQPEVRAHVSSSVFQFLKLGQTSEVDIDGKRLVATVTNLVNASDPTTYTHLIELHLRQGVVAPFGSYAEVKISTGRVPRVTVPVASVTRRAGLVGVFVVDRKSITHFRLIRVGEAHEGSVAVVAGLDSGEEVVVSPPMALMNGSKVRAQAVTTTSFSRNGRG